MCSVGPNTGTYNARGVLEGAASCSPAGEASFVLKGDIIHALSLNKLEMVENAYLVCISGISQGVFTAIPPQYEGLPLHDYSGRLVVPGLVDLHCHAPQYGFRGQGMDLELLDWLNQHTFPAEARFKDLQYAQAVYADFVRELKSGTTTRAALFATIHEEATLALMDLCEASGLVCHVGKVNMDRNAIPALEEAGAEASLACTQSWLEASDARYYQNTKPILTPRFAPSCSPELLTGLGNIQKQMQLPVQSHLSENPSEIEWVAKLFPNTSCYADAYLQSGLLGGENTPTIMAHCVYSAGAEAKLLKERQVWVAHCPESNTCLASGIAPVREFLDMDLKVGLGTDVAGGYSTSMLHTIAETIKMSKLRWRLVDNTKKPLNISEAFYLATKGGGSFFGKVGSFEPGYEFDALVIDEHVDAFMPNQPNSRPDLKARLERLVYLPEQQKVLAKYVAGRQIS